MGDWMDWLRTLRGDLPPLPMKYHGMLFGLFVVFAVASFLYSHRLGQKALAEGRAKKMLGQVPNFYIWRELRREVKAGNRVARFLLVSQLFIVIAFVIFTFWPREAAR